MNTLYLSIFMDFLLEACKHFKVRCNDNYMSVMLEDGTWKDVSYDKFKVLYLSSFIQTMMTYDNGGDK